MKNIKLMPDYGCFALWDLDNLGDLNPQTLPIPERLKIRLDAWADTYQATLNEADPAESGFETEALLRDFDAEGRRMWQELRAELGSEYTVQYYSVLENTLL